MANVETGFYSTIQAPDILGNVQKGLSTRAQMDENKIKRQQIAEAGALKDAYSKNMKTAEDGTMAFDRKGALAQLTGQGYGKQAYDMQTQGLKDDREMQAANVQMQQQKLGQISSLAGAATPENWSGLRQHAIMNKIVGEADMPEQFPGQEWLTTHKNMAMSYMEQLKQQNESRDFGLKERQTRTNEFEAGIKSKAELNKEKELAIKVQNGESLPIDQKEMVGGLAKSNANKTAIVSQIDSVMKNWGQLTPDQQYAQGNQLLKVLNSTEGKDAVGTDEAKRLGSKLEFAYGNFTNSSPTQFGRDLSGFADQARQTSANIKGATTTNQSHIDSIMGRQPKQTQVAHSDDAAVSWAMKNQGDPRATMILKMNAQAVGKR